MKKYSFIISVLISSFILFVVSCANASTLFSKADHAKKRANNIVNVTYDVDGGAQLEKSVYDFALGTSPDEIPTPVRAGYIFNGWYTKKSGGTRFTQNFILVDSITVYARWSYVGMTKIDPDDTMDNIYLTLGNSSEIIIPFEPANVEYNFSVTLNYSYSYPYDYTHMLHYEIQDKTLVLSSLEDFNYSGEKSIIGNIPLKIKDNISGKEKNITIHLTPKKSELIEITNIPDVYSDNYDYEIDLSSEKKYQLYSCTLTAGKGYLFWSTGTYNSTLSVYNSSYSRTNCYSFSSRYRMVCLPKQSGTYYLSVSNYNTEHPDNTVKFYVYEITLITDFTLSETSLTMQSGDTKTFQISSYTPPEAYAEFSLNNTGTRITSNTISGNVITMNAWVPGIDDVIVKDNITGISRACSVTVTSDPTKEINISVTGTAQSTTLSDYTVVNLTTDNYAVVNKLQLEAGKTYHFQHVDSIHQSTGNSDDRNGTIDCYYYLEDSTFHYLSRVDDWDMDYRCTKSGLYYYIITAYSFRNTGKGYYYIWAEDTP